MSGWDQQGDIDDWDDPTRGPHRWIAIAIIAVFWALIIAIAWLIIDNR